MCFDDLPRAAQVVGALHEAEGHEVHTEREAELEIVHVLERDRRRRQRHAGRVDPLVLAEQAAFDDGRPISPPSDR